MAWLALILAVVFNVLANVSFKFAMIKSNAGLFEGGILKTMSNPWLWSGGISSILLLLFYLTALRGLGLGTSYATVTSSALVLITVVSSFIFNEQITLTRGLGVLFIIIGLILMINSELNA